MLGYVVSKVGRFIENEMMRNIIGQSHSGFDLERIMNEKKIFLANLSKGLTGEVNSDLLGLILVSKMQMAAMKRARISEEARNDFYLYIDEFQNFTTDSIATILSEARKYRLNLILAHQYINQMEEEVRDAVFGNVGTIVNFRVGADDAEFFEKEFFPEFLAPDFVNLPKYHIYLKLMIDGLAARPFSAQTLPPLPTPQPSNRDKIIKVSRERYATPRAEVEDKISRWAGFLEMAAPSPAASAPMLYDAQCSNCKKWTKVVFRPEPGRPVYCKSCRKKLKSKEEAVLKPSASAMAPVPAPSVLQKAPEEKQSFISLGDLPKRNDMTPSVSSSSAVQNSSKPKLDVPGLQKALKDALNKKET